MRQAVNSFARGAALIFCFIFAQSLLGRSFGWRRLVPEGDFALLVLLSLSMGRTKGAFLGTFTGALRDALSIRSFGLGAFVLACVGLFSGILGETRRLPKAWQKILLIFAMVFFSDSLLLFLGGWKRSLASSGLFAFYGEAVLPSAFLATLMGVILWCFLL